MNRNTKTTLAFVALGTAAAAAATLVLTGTGRAAAAPARAPKRAAGIVKAPFGKTTDGTPVEIYTLTNTRGASAKIMTYGATLTELHVPDRNGILGDVVLGFDNLADYIKGSPFFGSTVGRYANRIAGGKFSLDGQTYTLAVNNGPNHLHGGLKAFDKKVWKSAPVQSADGPAVRFTLVSPDGDEGYPGTLNVAVTYTLTNRNGLRIDYSATTDKATPVNLTNHSYFNLTGNKRDVLGHVATFRADRYTPVDDTSIPSGRIAPVAGTPFDFSRPHTIGARINQIGKAPTNGYDHNYVKNGGAKLALAATVYEPTTGRVLSMYTSEPGFQFYTGNFLDGTLRGKNNVKYDKHDAFCLEAQHYPDSPNKSNFPSTILRPGQTYRQRTEYAFSTRPR